MLSYHRFKMFKPQALVDLVADDHTETVGSLTNWQVSFGFASQQISRKRGCPATAPPQLLDPQQEYNRPFWGRHCPTSHNPYEMWCAQLRATVKRIWATTGTSKSPLVQKFHKCKRESWWVMACRPGIPGSSGICSSAVMADTLEQGQGMAGFLKTFQRMPRLQRR